MTEPRIVSLLSSATEIACALGLADNIVGISHECDYPAQILDRPRVSSTRVDDQASSAAIDSEVRQLVRSALSIYDIDEDLLRTLSPDVILTQDHCEVCAVSLDDVEAACRSLTGHDAQVVSTMPHDLDGIRNDFRRIATACGVPERGERLVADFDEQLEKVGRAVADAPLVRIALIEWIDPPMIAGGWLPEIAKLAGTLPVIVDHPTRFETVTWDRIEEEDPDVVAIFPCGFGIERTLREVEIAQGRERLAHLRATRSGRTFVADGTALFNRPGPRIAESAEVLAALAHPDRVDLRRRAIVWRS